MYRTIRSVDDLAQLPDEELLACLGALRSAIQEAKRQHAAATRARPAPGPAAFSFFSFDWRPRGSQRLDMPAHLGPETLIDEVPVRASARDALKNLSIFCIEDLSAISEQELLHEEAIGSKTVGRLREILTRVGMDFLPDPDAALAMPEPATDSEPLPASLDTTGAEAAAPAPQWAGLRKLLDERERRSRDGSENMDWMGLYAYPTQITRLEPGDSGIFICPPAWRGRLATVCGIWIKGNTDWALHFPSGTPWKQIFWTEAHVDGLKLVRAPLPGQEAAPPRKLSFSPRIAAPVVEQELPRLDQVVSSWRELGQSGGRTRRASGAGAAVQGL